MSTMSSTIRVVAAVIARGERLLVCQRPFGKRHGGLWEFPGGKCEVGESDFVATSRELREELGVETISMAPAEFSVRDHDSQFLIAFSPVQIRGEPRALEHIALRWGNPLELAELPLAPSDRKYVEYVSTRHHASQPG